MSPLVEDRFAGHYRPGDPRGPLSAAGGCTWPTVPAFRYALRSDDATLDLAFFNTDPVLVEMTSPQPAHDLAFWQLTDDNPNVRFANAVRVFTPGQATYLWAFSIDVIAIDEALLLFGLVRNNETCNRDIPLPNVFAFDIDRGVTGDTFRMEQVEFDQSEPPGP